jgi:hypothetical protein
MINSDLSIVQTIESTELQIIIGEYFFTLISYHSNDLDNRGSVKIISRLIHSTETETFFVYRSKSELGFWRLCSYNKELVNLFKGDNDYVQQTFIHLDLQNFIDKNLNNIPIDEHLLCSYDNEEMNDIINEHINDTHRILQLKLDFNLNLNPKTPRKLSLISKIKKCSDSPHPETLEYISEYLKKHYIVILKCFCTKLQKLIYLNKKIIFNLPKQINLFKIYKFIYFKL